MRITVMGSGAVGGYFGARLAQAGHDVTFVARGRLLHALQQKGWTVQSSGGDFTLPNVAVEEIPTSAVTAHVVLFAVKSMATVEAAQALAPYIGANPTQEAALISLQNGIDNEIELAHIISPERVVGGVAYIEADMPEPGHIVHTGLGNLVIGQKTEAGVPFAHADEFSAACKEAGFECALTPDTKQVKWNKLVFNAALNPLTALTGTTLGELTHDAEMLRLIHNVLSETVAVASADGVTFPPTIVDNAMQMALRLSSMTSSMRRDFDRNKPLETEALLGAIVRRARQFDVPTPAVQTLYALLRIIDHKRGNSTPTGIAQG